MTLKKIFPIIEWFLNYQKAWLKGDISAGLTVGIMLIPQGIAYAMIAELPPIYGLYTAMIPQIVYAIFGTSRQLAVGPVAMDSLIVASGVATLAEIGTENFIEFAILLALMMGVLQVLFGIFRLGFLVNFLSKPVISGFTSAASLIIGLNQLKHLTGMNINRNSKLQNIVVDAVQHFKEVHLLTLSIGVISIITIVLFKKYLKKIPAALVVVIVSIIAVKLLHLEQFGVKIVGVIPEGLPALKIPHFDLEILQKLANMIDEINDSYITRKEVQMMLANQPVRSIEKVQKSVTAKVKKKDTLQNKSMATLYSEGVRHFFKKRYTQAQERFVITDKKGHKPAASNYYLGEIAYYTDQPSEAIFHFKKSAGLYGDASYMDTLLLHTAISLLKTGEIGQARAFFENIIATYPEKKTAKIAQDKLKTL
jgi:regulator of replication initiation timing